MLFSLPLKTVKLLRISRPITTTSFQCIQLTSLPSNQQTSASQALNPEARINSKVTVPVNALYKICFTETLVFFVFGFFDNFIMMTFGDKVDSFFGSYIPHPMIAAACGNWVSDLFGMGTSERVENYLNDTFPAPALTAEQLNSKQFHNWKYMGRFGGISLEKG